MAASQSALLLAFSILLTLPSSISSTAPSMEGQCSAQAAKVTMCMEYAIGKDPAPTGDCCSAVKEIRNAAAVCLCYITQQVSDGNPALKDFGLKVDRLLQMPSACKLANSSATECPKLLGLSPSSPDYALFMGSNSTKAVSGVPSPAAKASSVGFVHGPCHFTNYFLPLVLAIFFWVMTPLRDQWSS